MGKTTNLKHDLKSIKSMSMVHLYRNGINSNEYNVIQN